MDLLGFDIGSSSIKAAVLREGKIVSSVVRATFPTQWQDVRVEVNPDGLLRAMAQAVREIGAAARSVDAITLSVMSPAWVAMDKSGKALTPIVTHQDRRSVAEAREIEKRVGPARHLRIAGNLPFPGSISSTTYAWYKHHQPGVMRRADLVGHLNTFLHRQMTGARVIDPSNASFTGLYRTVDLGGWSRELCEAVGAPARILPEVMEANQVGGKIAAAAARRFGLKTGTPMLAGMIDTGAAMLLAGARPGQMVNVSGSTDVLILCTDEPRPDARLLTRALGVGRKWSAVGTLAAAGSALSWAHAQLFSDWTPTRFYRELARLAGHPLESAVRFEPYLAGERACMEQKRGAFTGLTLSTTREQMLSAMVEALAQASAARLALLGGQKPRISRRVMVSGGLQKNLSLILHRDWPGKWEFFEEDEATLRGLGRLIGVGGSGRGRR